jgi:putative ABC transport system permease protein
VLILGLAIGATTSIFSVVNAVLLRPLPYQDPQRLVAISSMFELGKTNRPYSVLIPTEMDEWRRESRTMVNMAAFAQTELPVRVGEQAAYPVTVLVDPEFFPTLGISPMLGAGFTATSGSEAKQEAMISHRLWTELFHNDPSAVGKPITVDGDLFTVAAVLPANFQLPRSDASFFEKEADLILPAKTFQGFPRNRREWLAVGRLRDGVTFAQAQAELEALSLRTSAKNPETKGWTAHIDSLSEVTARSVRRALLLTLGMGIVLLLIACTNIMNLLFSRAAARSREMAVRKAVGASSGRLVRQLLTESACLAGLAGIVGVVLAWASLDFVAHLSPVHLPVTGTIHLDARVFAFTFLICTAASILAGLFPALHAGWGGEDLVHSSGSRTTSGRALARIQRGLAVAQLALGLGLLTATGVLVHSMWRLTSVNPGFRPEGVLGFNYSVPDDHPFKQRSALYQRMLDEVRAIPGVTSAGMVTFLPPEPRAGVFGPCKITGPNAPSNSKNQMFCNTLIASAGYFKTIEMPIVQGRAFTEEDVASRQPVLIVNETLARRFFPNGDALGSKITTMFDPESGPREIVGIVKDAKDRGLGSKSISTSYTPMMQFALSYGSMAVRAQFPPQSLIPEIRARLAKVDSAVPLTDFQTINERIYKSLEEPRFYTVLATTCALMAVLFVTLGIYGLIAHSVSQRTPEIGIRMTLGAEKKAILKMILSQGMKLAALGIVLGLGLSLAFTRLLQNLLFEVKPIDPLSMIASCAFLAGVTLLASYIPARRASRVDPMTALRYE